jgi:hypothetical protein
MSLGRIVAVILSVLMLLWGATSAALAWPPSPI